jgi:hypothetical protein
VRRRDRTRPAAKGDFWLSRPERRRRGQHDQPSANASIKSPLPDYRRRLRTRMPATSPGFFSGTKNRRIGYLGRCLAKPSRRRHSTHGDPPPNRSVAPKALRRRKGRCIPRGSSITPSTPVKLCRPQHLNRRDARGVFYPRRSIARRDTLYSTPSPRFASILPKAFEHEDEHEHEKILAPAANRKLLTPNPQPLPSPHRTPSSAEDTQQSK